MKIRINIITILITIGISAQQGPTDFPELQFTKIPGAPVLSKPQLLTDENGEPLISEGHGLAAPAFYDWDGDGLKDLLIGEFGSGVEFGWYMGNFVRVYLNIGTDAQPAFSAKFDYARPPFYILSNGTPYSVDQFCCMGFTPQFSDLNSDGYPDMVSGQYYGEAVSFYGSPKGFLSGKILKQEGTPRDTIRQNWARNQPYWLYSSVSFGDFTKDGIQDMIVGGRALRISKNIGSSTEPEFETRKLLLDIDGNPLSVYSYSTNELASFARRPGSSIPGLLPPYQAGDYGTSPFVVDWDKDGILDLLVTNSYGYDGMSVIDFFRGRIIDEKHRFETAVPLFKSSKGKSFPGSKPVVSVTDWNNDGINDLLIGVSIITIQGKFSSSYAWNWEKELGVRGVAKDPGFILDRDPDFNIDNLLNDITLPQEISKEDYLTMRRVGYVYVMLGKK